MSATIVDIDGTLTTTGDRPRDNVIARVRELMASDDAVLIVSARPIARLDETRAWLRDHEVPYTELHLNDFADTPGPNVALAFKQYKYKKLIEQYGDALTTVVDNDLDVRAMARSLMLEALTPDEFAGSDAIKQREGAMDTRSGRPSHLATMACEFKAVGDGPVGTFSGYGAVFGNVDVYGERILPGAFTQTLTNAAQIGRLPAMLWQHDPTRPVGKWTAMREDARGLYVEGELADTQLGRETYALLKLGALSGLSIGFSVPSGGDRFDRTTETRELLTVDLWEVSPVTFPANTEARVAQVKFAGPTMTIREFEKFLRDAGGFSRTQAEAIAVRGFKAARDESAEDIDQQWLSNMAARFRA